MASEEFKQALGPKIRAAREWADYGILDAAAATGIGITTLYEYESCKKAPDAERLSLLSDLYGLTVGQILGREPLPKKRPARH